MLGIRRLLTNRQVMGDSTYTRGEELGGFDQYPKFPEAYAFETGSNCWARYNAWPPKEAAAKTIYLQAGGKLAFDTAKTEGFDKY